MRMPFVAGAVVMLIVCIVANVTWTQFAFAIDKGKAKRGLSDLHALDDMLARYREELGGYPAACEWEPARQMLLERRYVRSVMGEGISYCSDGEQYVLLLKPCGPNTPNGGGCSAFAIVNGEVLVWPPYWEVGEIREFMLETRSAS